MKYKTRDFSLFSLSCLFCLLPAAFVGAQPVPPHAESSSVFGQLTVDELALLGEDTNGNGVRDDVDAWITRTYPTTVSREAITRQVRWMTWAMIRGKRRTTLTTSTELDALAEVSACAHDLAKVAMGDLRPEVEELEAKIFNNTARTEAYLRWNASVSGMPTESSAAPCGHVSDTPKL